MHRKVTDPMLWGKTISTSLLDCEVEVAQPEAFHLEVKSRPFADLEFVDVSSGKHAAYRDRGRAIATERPCYLMVLQVAGEYRVDQDGRTAVLGPGEICFIDSRRPVTIETSDHYRGIGVKFPERTLDYPRENLANLTAQALRTDNGVTSAVCSLLLTLNHTIDTIEPSSQYKMLRGVLNLVEAMLSAIDPLSHIPDSAREVGIGQLKDYLEAHLDADLSPNEVAAAHFISVRQLHYRFQEAGTSMSTWVRTRRLERCQTDLADPRLKHLSISAIARRWGFHSSSHFGQVFKSATGLSPREFRTIHTEVR